jgi:hydroxymethylbilane synthase
VTPLRIGTRGSQLALWQARAVATLIECRGRAVELVTIKTTGDRIQNAPAFAERSLGSQLRRAGLSEAGGKRLFVKEIEDALLDGTIDLAVHSAKDMSAVVPDGLAVAATLPREDPRDALVLPASGEERIATGDGRTATGERRRARGDGRLANGEELQGALKMLGDAPAIGTGSVRRIGQLAVLLPDARFSPIRGNVDTRLRKLDAGEFDALVLACAGMRRLGFASRITAAIPLDVCVPAPGQGIVAVETRSGDRDTNAFLAALSDSPAAAALTAERALVAALGGGCQLPLGAIAIPDGQQLDMQAVVTSLDGRQRIQLRLRGPVREPADLGRRLAGELAAAGATALLEAISGTPSHD